MNLLKAMWILPLALSLASAQDPAMDKAKADAEKAKAAARKAEQKVKNLEQKQKAEERLRAATLVLDEVMGNPEKGIPGELLDKAECAVIVPGLKQGAFLFGGKGGRGFLTCRPESGGKSWSAPGAVRIEGGSFGFQAGVAEIDLIMLIMNKSGRDKLFGNKFTLGAGGTVAAGPVGRSISAATDAQMRAEILTWSRSRGAFAGVSVSGATLREDQQANAALYGIPEKSKTNRQIVAEMKPPAVAAGFLAALTKYSATQVK
jgi:lipid-binding SYLF domain-containing protein